MNILKIAGKYLDQPILVAKFEQKVPYLLTAGGAVSTTYSVKKTEQQDRQKTLQRSGLTMFVTILSALAAPKIYTIKPILTNEREKMNG